MTLPIASAVAAMPAPAARSASARELLRSERPMAVCAVMFESATMAARLAVTVLAQKGKATYARKARALDKQANFFSPMCLLRRGMTQDSHPMFQTEHRARKRPTSPSEKPRPPISREEMAHSGRRSKVAKTPKPETNLIKMRRGSGHRRAVRKALAQSPVQESPPDMSGLLPSVLPGGIHVQQAIMVMAARTEPIALGTNAGKRGTSP
mmetsp:Transcript_2907/g.6848  ORF Transcript_2907/g.6848 Transcript_2907/m.6848 type:complete len:209 (+) Transcript_2907:367-993(+)